LLSATFSNKIISLFYLLWPCTSRPNEAHCPHGLTGSQPEKGEPCGTQHRQRGSSATTPQRRSTAATLRRTLRRNHARQQPHLAGQTNHMAHASPGRRRPVRTRPPTRCRTGPRRRSASEPTSEQSEDDGTTVRIDQRSGAD